MISKVPGAALAATRRAPASPAAVGMLAGRLCPGGRRWHLGLDAGEELGCAATTGTKRRAGVPACGSAYSHVCIPSHATAR